jgi:aminoglycoside 6'-N-acetyltransferase
MEYHTNVLVIRPDRAAAMSGGGPVSLIPFDRSRAPLLAGWLARPHVAQWFPDPGARLEWALDPPTGGANALIACDGRPVGYLSWRKVFRETLDAVGLHDIPAGSVDIDILIGEADCVGRGLGPKALALLVERLRADPTVPLAGLTPSVANLVAQRAYEKAGFRKLREYEAPGLGRGVLMAMRLERIDREPAHRRQARG